MKGRKYHLTLQDELELTDRLLGKYIFEDTAEGVRESSVSMKAWDAEEAERGY